MLDEIQQIESKAVAEIQAAQDEKTLEELRIRHLGRKSPLRLVMGQIGQLPATERPASGQLAGQAQKAIQQAFDDKEMALAGGRSRRRPRCDPARTTALDR